MILKKTMLILVLSILAFVLSASEGMWLPILLEKYNIEEMQAKGFKLTAQDIYDINNASLKDAVVGLVRLSNPFHHFCTGEIISNQGLLLTNHHCGYGQIQKHSSVDKDYLTDGYWAMSLDEELTNEGIGVCFLKRMEDVTDKVLKNITSDTKDIYLDSIIAANIKTIEEKAVEGTHYLAKVKPFFSGNEYYLSVYEIFRDIRLVGAPPSAIGKFGGDTDNWMWPRHTGDFSLFRIYANKENKPADISDDNVPYKPLQHLKISLNGVKKGDFTMVMGYPGTTNENLPSAAVKQITETINPIRINVRTKSIDIMKADMANNPQVRIKYASKVANTSNGWKKWIGENRGLKRLDAIRVKQQLENNFIEWANANEMRKKEYADLINQYNKLYKEVTPLEKTATYLSETIYSLELLRLASSFNKLISYNKTAETEEINKQINSLKNSVIKIFKDYNQATDKKLFTAFISLYFNEVDEVYHPKILNMIDDKFNGDIEQLTEYFYEKSIFSDSVRLNKFLETYSVSKNKKLQKDPFILLYEQSINIYHSRIYPGLVKFDQDITHLNKSFTKGLREYQANKNHFPDANSTFRIAYGQVDDYEPKDAVKYYYQTTIKGIMEKDNPTIYDYKVPDKLKQLYQNKNYGDYSNPDGTIPVCFTASNHTTGGNSGSPILNGQGQLIGINFDRNWEGTMSDIMYDPEMCRNIALDIRYVLFIIDKYANAHHLINELSIIKEQ